MKDRNKQGKFVKGSKGGPGRPPRKTEAVYLQATVNVCPVSSWKKIVLQAVKDAEKGDSQARLFLAKYLIGEPVNPEPERTQIVVSVLNRVD